MWSPATAAVYGKLVRRWGSATWRKSSEMAVVPYLGAVATHGGTIEAANLCVFDVAYLLRITELRRQLGECRHLVINSTLTTTFCEAALVESLVLPHVERLVCAVTRTDDDALRCVVTFIRKAFPSRRLRVSLRIQQRKSPIKSNLWPLRVLGRTLTALELYSPFGIAPTQLERMLASTPAVASLTLAPLRAGGALGRDAVAAATYIEEYGRVLASVPSLQAVTVVLLPVCSTTRRSSLHEGLWNDMARRHLTGRHVRFTRRTLTVNQLFAT